MRLVCHSCRQRAVLTLAWSSTDLFDRLRLSSRDLARLPPSPNRPNGHSFPHPSSPSFNVAHFFLAAFAPSGSFCSPNTLLSKSRRFCSLTPHAFHDPLLTVLGRTALSLAPSLLAAVNPLSPCTHHTSPTSTRAVSHIPTFLVSRNLPRFLAFLSHVSGFKTTHALVRLSLDIFLINQPTLSRF